MVSHTLPGPLGNRSHTVEGERADDVRRSSCNSLTSVSIRGGYFTGHDVTGLDNVSFNASAVPLPASAFSGAALLAAYGAVLRWRRPSTVGR